MGILIWGEGWQEAHHGGLAAAMAIGRRGAPVRGSAGCRWLGWRGWRAPPSSGDAMGGVDGAGGAPEAVVDSGQGKVAMARSSGVARARRQLWEKE
jgi:hypothetical protein